MSSGSDENQSDITHDHMDDTNESGDTEDSEVTTSWDLPDDYVSRVPEVPDIEDDDISGKFITGTDADERLTGGANDDVIIGGGGNDWLNGYRGDDVVWLLDAEGESGAYTQYGDDTIAASVPGTGQVHIGAGDGNDRIILDMTNEKGFQSFHVYTGTGEDTIEFENFDAIQSPILGRIDDFDPSRDTLVFEGEELDLNDLPDGIDVVAYNGQQWLRFEDRALFTLEGARDGGTERHFTELPDDISSLPVVDYVDPQNHVPSDVADTESGEYNRIDVSGQEAIGTDGDDWITDDQVYGTMSMDDSDMSMHDHGGDMSMVDPIADVTFHAGAGDDVVDAGKGLDTIYGGEGNDALAGGLDDDVLYGEEGDDTLYGGTEDDQLYGGEGNDTLYGGKGDDLISGGEGADDLTGGEGSDTFSFDVGDLVHWKELEGTHAERYEQIDIIHDFTVGEDVISFDPEMDLSLDDLMAWQEDFDGNLMYVVKVVDTEERFLIDFDDEDDETSWGDFMNEDSFSF
jgi:Ca2+-binding RTX toxin-like protein